MEKNKMDLDSYSQKEIQKIIKEVLKKLYEKDIILIENDTHEQAISHVIACYLAKKFENWDVDCEYNRDLENPKTYLNNSNETKYIRPDIIVHKRKTEKNLLVIEIKKDANDADKEKDIKKLNCMLEKYGYKYALFINLQSTRQETECIWKLKKDFEEESTDI